uniref:Protein kinase domain-containing protein n=1 Tax=Mycena chlorophos TaxID=658473 RepID=A0ABQ0LZ86_MYCCL|nr:predicted protein [Mycena chlorophos]
MVALHRPSGFECAVKFIVKAKIPARAWVLLDDGSRLPSEIVLLRAIDHPNVVKFIEWFEDEDHFYLIQELHGSPWFRTSPSPTISASSSLPSLSPSDSTDSITLSPPITPPSSPFCAPLLRYPRRPSYDLFEFIEQHKEKRLSEDQARYVLKQVVEAVAYLDRHGATHRDIKDENIVIDDAMFVKLVDFGASVVEDPSAPRPYHTTFFGTSAYASPEILKKQPYQAPPAEVFSIGVLLVFMLTGYSPFLTPRDAMEGNIVLTELPKELHDSPALDLIRVCLEVDVKKRATIEQVRAHPWLRY